MPYSTIPQASGEPFLRFLSGGISGLWDELDRDRYLPVTLSILAATRQSSDGQSNRKAVLDALAEIPLDRMFSLEYDGFDELRSAWDDPERAVSWPDPEPILSPRDAAAPSLARLLANSSTPKCAPLHMRRWPYHASSRCAPAIVDDIKART